MGHPACLWFFLSGFCLCGPADCVFTFARVVQTAIGGAGELAAARPFDTFHLPGTAGNLVLIRPGLECAVFHGSCALVVVDNRVTAIEGFHKDARVLHVGCRNFCMLREGALLTRRTSYFSRSGALSLCQGKSVARLVTSRNTLLDVSFATLAGQRSFGLRRGHRNGQSNDRTDTQIPKSHSQSPC